MSERELYATAPLVFGGVLLLGVVLFAVSLALLRRRRTGESYRLRRRAGERGGRLFILSVALLILGAAGALAWIVVSLVFHQELYPSINRGEDDVYGVDIPVSTLDALTALAMTPTATLTFTPSSTFTPTDTPTPTATFTPSATPTPLPTLTYTLTPTETESPTPLIIVTNTPIPVPPTRARPTPPVS